MVVVMLHISLLLAPALALALPLLVRRYPGERTLLRLSETRRRSTPARGRTLARPRRPLALQSPRGGLLLGRSLAERPPPACGCPA
jgi:hypothetical protein